MAVATHIEENDAPEEKGPQRTCVVTRRVASRHELLRFVAGPSGEVVPDLKAVLPGRGMWLTPTRAVVKEAMKKRAFSRGLKLQATPADDLPDVVEALLRRSALGAMGFARKAGECLTGAGKVQSAARSDKALAVLHAADGADDGYRKAAQWVFAGARDAVHAHHEKKAGGVPLLRVFTADEMSLALGSAHVIHAAIMKGGAGANALACVLRLAAYEATDDGRGEPDDATPSTTRASVPAPRRGEQSASNDQSGTPGTELEAGPDGQEGEDVA